MRRYFFDLKDGEVLIDQTGVELANMTEVKRTAGERMASALQGGFNKLWRGDDWSIIVRSEAGAIVLILTLVATETGVPA